MSDNTENPADHYEIGYGKPPKAHQFQKGKCPNPKGRPKGAKGLKTLVCEAAEATAEYTANGKKTKSSRVAIALHQLSLKAAKGDLKAIDKLTHLYGQFGPPSEPDESMIDAVADIAVLDEFVALATKFGSSSK